MVVKVTTGCMNWSQSSVSQSTSSSSSSSSPQTLAYAISSPSSKRRSFTDVTIICRPSVFGNKLIRSRSCETLTLLRNKNSIKRIVSANFDSQFSQETHDLDLRFKLSDLPENHHKTENFNFPASIERKANSVEFPFSLRIIKKKKQLEERFMEAGESAYCSMKKAFSSMVFIIRELQSFSLQMREVLYFEDLQDILIKVQKEMNASFVWLFQQVFSHTPNLMVYVMILLANYSVYSMSNHVAIATPLPPTTVELVSMVEDQTDNNVAAGKTVFINSGGINGGGGKYQLHTSGTDGEGKFDGASSSTINPAETVEESVSGQGNEVEESGLWKLMAAEAEKMQGVTKDGGLDRETMRRFVSPVTAKMEEGVETEDYEKTDLLYQMGLSKEPDNPLLLANYAQFLYLFAHDHKRAETFFKKASEIEPKDAEALSKYASFLWHAKNDLWAAEETFLEAISADPSNSFYTAAYANFLWLNGGDDTCYPLDSPENVNSDEF